MVTGRITLSSTGIKTFSLGFQPSWIQFRVCQKVGTAEDFSHLSIGEAADILGTITQQVTSTFQDTTGGKSANDTTKVVSHYERVGGVLTEVLSASFHSFTATGFKVTVHTGNPNYQVIVNAGS